jgi:hypothetical protein
MPYQPAASTVQYRILSLDEGLICEIATNMDFRSVPPSFLPMGDPIFELPRVR